MSQRPSFTYHFDAYSRKMMSLLFKAFFFFPPAVLGLHCGVQALKLWCAGWVVVCGILVLQTRTEPTPALGASNLIHWTTRQVPPAVDFGQGQDCGQRWEGVKDVNTALLSYKRTY